MLASRFQDPRNERASGRMHRWPWMIFIDLTKLEIYCGGQPSMGLQKMGRFSTAKLRQSGLFFGFCVRLHWYPERLQPPLLGPIFEDIYSRQASNGQDKCDIWEHKGLRRKKYQWLG
jgi:hypothetical protein